jgi:AhpC/TSA family
MGRLNAPAPDFALDGIVNGQARRVRLSDFRGRWGVLVFDPADFTLVCPTEIRGFQARRPEFARRDCDILGVSVDDVESHRAWAVELGGAEFPLLSDSEDPQHEPGRDDEGVHDDDVLDGGRATAPGGRHFRLGGAPIEIGRDLAVVRRRVDGPGRRDVGPGVTVPGRSPRTPPRPSRRPR